MDSDLAYHKLRASEITPTLDENPFGHGLPHKAQGRFLALLERLRRSALHLPCCDEGRRAEALLEN